MRRRWRAMLEDGSLASLRSEGRLAALYVLYAADFSTCQVRMSIRRAAKLVGVHPTTIRRGITQMISCGVLEVLEKPEGSGRTVFLVTARAPVVPPPGTSGVQERAHSVPAIHLDPLVVQVLPMGSQLRILPVPGRSRHRRTPSVDLLTRAVNSRRSIHDARKHHSRPKETAATAANGEAVKGPRCCSKAHR